MYELGVDGLTWYQTILQYHEAYFHPDKYVNQSPFRFIIKRQPAGHQTSPFDEVMNLVFTTGLCEKTGLSMNDLLDMDMYHFDKLRTRVRLDEERLREVQDKLAKEQQDRQNQPVQTQAGNRRRPAMSPSILRKR